VPITEPMMKKNRVISMRVDPPPTLNRALCNLRAHHVIQTEGVAAAPQEPRTDTSGLIRGLPKSRAGR